ncbi:hypothetical protein ABTY53_37185 [Streptomyces noursei]|uniref:hypothetical protein n=1 Tax=Streptomyces noursei TaxID=1971 RepID=UPI0033249E24
MRHLVTAGHIPDDVVISVFTPARPERIDRTSEALRDAERAMVHLCNAPAPIWRDAVFSMPLLGICRADANFHGGTERQLVFGCPGRSATRSGLP